MKFCQKCGKELLDEYVACPVCGCPTNISSFTALSNENTDLVLKKLSEKMKIYGIIWLVIAVIQILLGIFLYWMFLIIGVVNIVTSVMGLKYSKDVLEKPSGIVEKFQPIAGPIFTLVYNFLFGGVIGVIGSIYYFVGIRNYVMENKELFKAIETKTMGN